MSDKKIIWQRIPKIDDGEIEVPKMPDEMLSNELLEMEDEEFGKEYYKGIVTNLGIFPINENVQPLSFFIGHTNFKITNSIRQLIKQTEGIEFLLILTPYRFKIAIGKAWIETGTDPLVRQNINNAIKGFFQLIEGSDEQDI